jgi:alpha-amylase
MSNLRLILALHNHQPVGNFEGVFEAAYRDSYLPFLEVLERYPEITFCLHTSGPLLEWLVDQRPDYVARARGLVEAGRVEILGGGYFEPIMTMIPHVDRVGQIRSYTGYLEEVFGAKIRGMWTPERVWEQHLVSAFAEAGAEYTVLDDFHFEHAGVSGDELFGYYLTEDEGRLLKVFPGSEALRYTIPFQEPHATYQFLRDLAARRPGSTVVFADDGEKFGSWPETYNHVYTRGWLTRFCDMIVGNKDWIASTTLGRTVDSTLPLGKVYISDGSYREMTEWALAPGRHRAHEQAARMVRQHDRSTDLKPFFRAGGFWRNFKAKYPESDEMYARMLGLSQRLAALSAGPDADPDYLDAARRELHRGQCNCPYWHGAFGGLYLPHLRGAIYQALIACHDALDEAEEKAGPRVELEVGDFNFDARQEVRIENDRFVAFFRPAQGGHLYELDARGAGVNLLATLNRRPEPYHQTILDVIRARGSAEHGSTHAGADDKVVLKHDGLDDSLVYDDHPRKAFVDHFYPPDVTIDDLAASRFVERGDFVGGAYLARVKREGKRVSLVMERPGLADDLPIKIRQTVEAAAGSPILEVRYEIEEIPADARPHFAVEINLAGMAGHADDRYYATPSGERLGTLDALVDRPALDGLSLSDEWLDLRVGLSWSKPGGLWCLPIETVSQSEGGFEKVYQSSAVIPHWQVVGDESGRWEVSIRLALGTCGPPPADDLAPERKASLAEV